MATASNASNAAPGTTGPQSLQCPPGEVTNAALASAIAGTSVGSNGVATLGLAVGNPPTQAEVQAIARKLDELILALRRQERVWDNGESRV